MYNEKVALILKEMKNMGRVKHANGIGKEKSVYGDIVEFFLHINESGIIEDASFKAFGSPYLVASCSILVDLVKGKAIADVFHITEFDLQKVLGEIDLGRYYVFELTISTFIKAIKNYYSKQEKKENK